VARAAKEAKIPYVIIELNPETIRRERALGEPIIYGDATGDSILSHVQIHKARVVVVAISDPAATKRLFLTSGLFPIRYTLLLEPDLFRKWKKIIGWVRMR
jgi:CPA2 family monovalent cation:H+ antiporter-2